MIQLHRFTVLQEETNFIYMQLLRQVMKWNTSCTMSSAIRNRSFNYLRDEKRRSIREAQFLNNLKAEEEGYNSALENEIYRQLKLLLEELPEQCKNIFQRTLSGDTSEKIAADLKLSVETVKTQRKKAKRILRERYTLLFKTFGILF